MQTKIIQISELHPLAQNSAYRKIVDVYLDDNVLNSVRPLEGSDWMLNFRILSLRGNNLSHVVQLQLNAIEIIDKILVI